ncbi:hypothetical protein V6N12_009640 [Hibiscus sabdariffa]|uniref:Reverse transcriptase domain-containing protein n=1 Tax=Hibiscus sabdariffa TaxID=183260 RepID=A0ABR2BUG5_9ROSI
MKDPTPSDVQKDPEFVIDSPIEEDKGEKLDNEKTEEQHVNATASATPKLVRDEVRPPPPFPQRLKKHKEDLQFQKFVSMLYQFHINIPFLEAIEQVPSYAKFLKDIVTKKRKAESYEIDVVAFEYCAGRIDLPMKKLRYMGDHEECHHLQKKNITAVEEDSDIICCSKFIQIKNFERLKKEDAEEPEATPCESNQVCSFIIRPGMRFEALDFSDFTSPKPSLEHAPSLELKPLPPHLKCVYLGSNEILPLIISSKLLPDQECGLTNLLSQYKKAIGWTMADLKGISPTICMHKIILEECHSNSVEPQRRLNPAMKKVVMKEIIKWLDAGVIYPISDSSWVSHVQCVPKKGGITVVTNDENELLPTRTVTGLHICMDYRKLNKATKKDHFPLPFIDQMLDRLAGKEFYCFLDGYSGYNQFAIAPEDQEKTTFTYPFGTYAFRRMPFGLCNAPATFQCCMLAIFSYMVEEFLEVFMDDFSVSGETFDSCLGNLAKVLKRCEEADPMLNWEKCHFIVNEVTVLGHKISSKGIEVDKAKVVVIEKFPPPVNVKGIRSFLGHAGFYRKFIKDFSKISKPL